jgi:ribA/ribD-fused uncharacterized protein
MLPGHLLFHSRARKPVERMLSNFHPSPVVYEGVRFPSVENAFQAAKFLRSTRPDLFASLAGLTPAEAKRRGSKSGMKAVGAVLDAPRWDSESVGVMKALVALRMDADAEFRRVVEDGRRAGLAFLHFERSGARSFWGGCFPKGAPRTPAGFVGRNTLGKILMGSA